MTKPRSPLGTVTVPCPMCARDVQVDIVADDGTITDGQLIVKLSARYEHDCPT